MCGNEGVLWFILSRMSRSDALPLRAVREATDSLNDALQVVLLEGDLLYRAVGGDGTKRLDRLMAAARKAAWLSKAIYGEGPVAEPSAARISADDHEPSAIAPPQTTAKNE